MRAHGLRSTRRNCRPRFAGGPTAAQIRAIHSIRPAIGPPFAAAFELAVEQVPDVAARLIAFLDDIDGDTDAEDDGTADPMLAPLIAGGAQIRWARFDEAAP